MLFRGRLGDSVYSISLQPHSLTVGVDEQVVVAWDRGGRLYSVYRDEHTFRRGLDGRVLEKWQDADGERHWDRLDGSEADSLVDDAARLAGRVADAMAGPRWAWLGVPSDDAVAPLPATLAAAAAFTGARAREDATRFASLYRPVGILPPDQYLALVLQATEGCSFNTCSFCDLYHEGYRVKTPDEFARHVAEVRAWLGPSLGLRGRAVFLGAANALAVPMPRLVPLMEALGQPFGPAAPPVSAFVDGFTGARKTAGDYRRLASLGLRRVYVGLESGHDPLLAFVGKPGSADDAVDTVRAVKAGGLHAGVIVMTGLGGDRYAEGHVRDTARALNAMGLGDGDLLYFSDLVETPATAYPRLATEHGIRGLTAPERAAQRQALRERLVVAGAGPKLATYDVREFVY